MIARWIGPLLLAAALALASYWFTLSRTPQVLMGAAVSRLAKVGGINRMTAAPLATAAARTIVRPSPDLAYSHCTFDLAAGPIAITAMPVPAPYWSLSVFDANTDVAFVRNNLESGGNAVRIVVAMPDQSVAPGIEVVRVAKPRGVALLRVLVNDRARFPAIDAARRRSSCATVAARR